MKKSWIILVLVVVVFVALFASSYNGLISSNEEVLRKSADIDAQLKRRADAIGNLVESVKGYAAHETEIFKNVSDARARLLGAGTAEEKAAANEAANGALGRLLVVSESYPELKASQNFIQLSDELIGTENRIAVARIDYNTAVTAYNKKILSFPSNIFASSMGLEKADYFEAAAGDREAPKVDFGK